MEHFFPEHLKDQYAQTDKSPQEGQPINGRARGHWHATWMQMDADGARSTRLQLENNGYRRRCTTGLGNVEARNGS